MAMATLAARRGASSAGSSPKTASTLCWLTSLTRPPKLWIFSTSRPRMRVVTAESVSGAATMRARRKVTRRRSQRSSAVAARSTRSGIGVIRGLGSSTGLGRRP
jgi:hypothetical protein